jgi:hypothetical protein
VTKRKTGRTRKSTAQKSDEMTEFVVTLNVPQRKIVKVESVDSCGMRHVFSDLEFARLIADDEVEDIVAVGIV